jgi:hypothetical protein
MINSANSTFHQRPESFNGVGVNIAANVHASTVLDSAMAILCVVPILVENVLNPIIGAEFIGIDGALGHNVFADHAEKSRTLHIINHAGNNSSLAAFPFNDSRDWCFLPITNHRPTSAVFTNSAEVGFVHLHRWSLQLQVAIGEQGANLMEHAPCSFVGNSSLALNLLSGYTATSGTHEIHGIEPSLERSSALLKDGASERIDVIPAMVASISSATSNAIVFAVYSTLGTEGNTVRPTLFFDVLQAGIIGRKFKVEILESVPEFGWNALRLLDSFSHDENMIAECLLVVKG